MITGFLRLAAPMIVAVAVSGCAYSATGDGVEADTCQLRIEKLDDAGAGPHAFPVIAGVAGEKVLNYALIGLTYAGQALFDELAEEGEASYSRGILLDAKVQNGAETDFMCVPRARHRFSFTRGGTPASVDSLVSGARHEDNNEKKPWIDLTTSAAVIDTTTSVTHFEFVTEVSKDGQAMRLTEAKLAVRSTAATVRKFPLLSSEVDINLVVLVQAPLNLDHPETVTLGAFMFSAKLDVAKDWPEKGDHVKTWRWKLADLQNSWLPVPRSYQLSTFVPVNNYRVEVQVVEKAEAVEVYRKLSELMEKAREKLKDS